MEHVNKLDPESMRKAIQRSMPFPNICIDNFLDERFAMEVCDALVPYGEALKLGRTFSAVNETGKVQLTDARAFPKPVAALNSALASSEFLDVLSFAFGIPNLLADSELVGGGIHQTGPRGRLDVHIDFNYIEQRKLHRRLNILLYLNKVWQEEWGGRIELWDKDVKTCVHSFAPIFNRCIIFETSEISYHGVTAVRCPEGQSRKSFAAYYYTNEAPPEWKGQSHTTSFRARPNEKFKGAVLMPAERLSRMLRGGLNRARHAVRVALSRSTEPRDRG